LIFLGFEIGQRWPEAVMHSWGSYFVPVPNGEGKLYPSLEVRIRTGTLVQQMGSNPCFNGFFSSIFFFTTEEKWVKSTFDPC